MLVTLGAGWFSATTPALWNSLPVHIHDIESLGEDMSRHIFFYYIDMSVLLENIPLVKFIKTASGTRVVYFP